MDPNAVHIFWDHSNLYISAQDACDDRGTGLEPGHRLHVRLDFQKVFEFAVAGRSVERAVAVGSIPPGLHDLWDRLKAAGGIELELQERGAESGKEQGVDQALQAHMLRSLADREPPAIAVLLSGDGGYYDDLCRLLKRGWGAEVLCFGGSLSGRLTSLSRDSRFQGRAKYVDLDGWYSQLVYLQGPGSEILRPSEQLDLRGRPRV